MQPVAPQSTGTEILALLRSGQDRRLADDLFVRPDGSVAVFPTLRCTLMEKLREVDPGAAQAYARDLLAGPSVPPAGEMVLAGRALALSPAAPQVIFLLQKAAQRFLEQEAWLQQPDRAVLECFDLAVVGFTPQVAAKLEQIAGGEYPEATQFACELAVHRMALTPGHPIRAALNDAPAAWNSRPGWRGLIFAHADVRNPDDARELARFLHFAHDKARTLDIFASSFPAAVFNASSSLISQGTYPSVEDLARRDAASLEWIASLQLASFNQPAAESITTVAARLREDVARARANGLLLCGHTRHGRVPGAPKPAGVQRRRGVRAATGAAGA